ncbi:MAG: pseudouridine-5'-phosphate glycosidase, partial [Thermoplasmata archaeon]
MKKIYKLSKEVEDALKSSKPIVALETAILTHGLPRPENVNLALELEKIIRKEGAIPATIGIIDGIIKIGCSKEEILRLGYEKNACKASIRDLPIISARRLCGGTTVASTAFIASKVGIKVFVTGGIGGVHRRIDDTKEQNYDVSADIPIIGLESILIVSSGAK